MIMKLIGCSLIILAGTMSGYTMSRRLKIRLGELKSFEKVISMLRGEIRYNNSTISEAMIHVSKHTISPFDQLLEKTSVQLDAMEGRTFSDIWKNNIDDIKEGTNLSAQELTKIKNIGESLGYLDKEMQLNTFDMFIEQTKKDIVEMEKTIGGNVRLCNYLGVMGGILVVLIIV